MRKLLHMLFYCWLLAVFLTGCSRSAESYLINETLETARSEDTKDPMMESAAGDQSEGFLYVHVCGEVVNPGGMTEDAAAEAVNQASLLTDGQQIVVPSVNEQALAASEEASGGLVNINQADAAELMTLPGIGEAKAADIIAYRETQGGFASIEDIKKVSGIKDALFNKIKDKIVV